MAIIVEDGTGVANANSYVTLAEARDYAQNRGVTLPADDAAASALLFPAMDYIESFRARYQGRKTYPTEAHPAPQALQWPRVGVSIDGQPWPADMIPAELKAAQSQMIMEVMAAGGAAAIAPVQTGKVVKKEKVDVIEREFMTYAELGGVTPGAVPTYPAVDWLLEPLFSGNGRFITTVRI